MEMMQSSFALERLSSLEELDFLINSPAASITLFSDSPPHDISPPLPDIPLPEIKRKRPAKVKLTRWQREQNKMGGLRGQADAKLAEAEEIRKQNEQLQQRMLAMELAVAAKERHMNILAQYNRVCTIPAREHGRAFTMTHSSKELLDMKQAAGLSVTAVAAMYYEAIDAVSLLLLQQSEACMRGAPEDPRITDSISTLIVELCTKLGYTFVLNPSMQFQVLTHRLDALDGGISVPHSSHWDNVVEEIRPTPQQLSKLRACWDLTKDRVMDKLHIEINGLIGELGRALEGEDPVLVMDLHKRLSAVMLRESMAYRCVSFMCLEIFTPLQVGRVMVHSWPYYPSVGEIARRLLGISVP